MVGRRPARSTSGRWTGPRPAESRSSATSSTWRRCAASGSGGSRLTVTPRACTASAYYVGAYGRLRTVTKVPGADQLWAVHHQLRQQRRRGQRLGQDLPGLDQLRSARRGARHTGSDRRTRYTGSDGPAARWHWRTGHDGRQTRGEPRVEDRHVTLSELDKATERLVATVGKLTDEDLRAPSRLPGWSRGHVKPAGMGAVRGRSLAVPEQRGA
jgi:hypothetical protein